MATLETMSMHAIAQGVGCFFGCAVGVPLAVIVLDEWNAWRNRHVERKIAKRVANRLEAIKREERRNACRRCGHPRETHDEEPDGCRAILVDPKTSARAACECEAFSPPSRSTSRAPFPRTERP